MDKISKDTIKKCQEKFENYKGIKKYKLINLSINLIFIIPFIVIYGVYRYNDYSDNLEILFAIMLITMMIAIIIVKKIKYKAYNERIKLLATQYTKTNLETISILEDNNYFKVLQNKQEIASVKKNKIVETIKVDDANLVIYSQRMGFLNFIIVK